MLKARIIGTGSYLPEKVWTNKDLEAFCDTNDEWIRQRTGIEERHVAEKGVGVSDLAIGAAQMALENAEVSPDEIDAIIFCTLTPDMLLPGSAPILQKMLGASNAAAFDLNAACSGFVYGLATANSYIRSGLFKTVLLIGAEIQTNRMTWENRDTAVLFADGAGAVVLRAEEGEHGVLTTHLGSDGDHYEVLHLPKGGSREPITRDNVDEKPYTIYMKGPELFKRAVKKFPEVSQQALDATGLTYDDIDLFIPHQANLRIIEAAGQRMGIDPERVFVNIQKTGNTTAASIPIAMHQALGEGRLKEGDNLLLAAFGGGITWGSAIIRW